MQAVETNQTSRTIWNHGPELGDWVALLELDVVELLDRLELGFVEALLKHADPELDGAALFGDVLFDPAKPGKLVHPFTQTLPSAEGPV